MKPRIVAGILFIGILIITEGVIMAGGGKIKRQMNDETIDSYGQLLARWAGICHVTVRIDGQAVNGEEPSAGGYSGVFWDYFENIRRAKKEWAEIPRAELIREAEADPAWAKAVSQYKSFLGNLKRAFEASSCDEKQIKSYFLNLERSVTAHYSSLDLEKAKQDVPQPDQLAKDLACLGKFEFRPVSFSSD